MKILLTTLYVAVCSSMLGCSVADHQEKVEGYPVYKFLNFGGVNSKAFKAHKAESMEFLGGTYETVAKQHDLFVSRGFDHHTPLMVYPESGKKVEVYIRDADYKLLWKTDPLDLADLKKSHRVTITYVPVKVGDEWVNRAVTFSAEIVERDPIIRK